MSLIPQATLNAAEIDRINRESVSLDRHQLTRTYALVMESPQAVLDAMGTQAVSGLTRYAARYAMLAAIGEADGLTAPDYAAFQPREDGTVLYVAPVIPEPEPEIEPEP